MGEDDGSTADEDRADDEPEPPASDPMKRALGILSSIGRGKDRE